MIKLLTFLLLPASAICFAPVSRTVTGTASALSMAPKFDATANKWFPSSAEEGPEAGYDMWGSLLRQGPNPFFQRLFQADEYEQGKNRFCMDGLTVPF